MVARAELNNVSQVPLPGLGPAPSGGLTTNSRRTGCEIGRIRPTNVFERTGESRMTPPASALRP